MRLCLRISFLCLALGIAACAPTKQVAKALTPVAPTARVVQETVLVPQTVVVQETVAVPQTVVVQETVLVVVTATPLPPIPTPKGPTATPTKTLPPTKTPPPAKTLTRTKAPTPTKTETPTKAPTATKTDTPVPTDTPEPTLAPITWASIKAAYEGFTDVQWKAYCDSVKGKLVINWSGTVEDVSKGWFGGYSLDLDVDADRTVDVSIDIPGEGALAYKKGQRVKFTGTIWRLYKFLGPVLSIEKATVE